MGRASSRSETSQQVSRGRRTRARRVRLGGLAVGVFAFGGLALGIFALGGLAIGVVALGAVPQGWLAIGGAAAGVYAVGGAAWGAYVISARPSAAPKPSRSLPVGWGCARAAELAATVARGSYLAPPLARSHPLLKTVGESMR